MAGLDPTPTDIPNTRLRAPLWKRRPRLTAGTTLAVVVFLLLPSWVRVESRLLIAFDAGAFIFLGATWRMMMRATSASMRHRARFEDESRHIVLALAAGVAAAILLAIGFELHGMRDLSPSRIGIRIALACATILASWLFMNTMFALHYALDFYGDADNSGATISGGLMFPGGGKPDYWDLLYFSFVIGMTFQVSDVQIESPRLRRVVLAHGVLGFFFNVGILALVINIVAGVI
jgi:uncharacterized membrane protein